MIPMFLRRKYTLDSQMKALFTPIKIGPLELPNRIIMSAITTLYDVENNSRWIDFYEERARGGAGLLIVGGLQTIFPGRISRLGKVHLYEDRHLDRLNELTRAVHSHGAKVAAQLATHNYWAPNGKADSAEYIGPSEVDIPTAELHPAFCGEAYLPRVRALTADEIFAIEEAVGDAAARAKKAGFDAVELLVAAGNLFNRFLNPFTNRRTDEFGGSTENRMRIVTDVIANIQKKVGRDFPLICRISALDMLPWGLDLESWKKIAVNIEKAGVHALSIYPGWHETRQPRHQMCVPRGNFVYLAASIKQVVGIPVAANGRINDARLADQIVSEGKADLIAMGTPLIADPDLPKKAMENRLDDIRMCCGCCNCWDRLIRGKPIDCSVNAGAGKGGQYPNGKSPKPKKLLVIGGGPGGMEASRVAALRGHRVTLYEKNDRLGGQLLYAVLPPYKNEWANLIRYLCKQIEDLNVDIRLNTTFTAEMVADEKPDAVIVATGAEPIIPDIRGIDRGNVVGALEVLAGREKVGQKVAIVGGGALGCEIAEFLQQSGKQVTIIEMLDDIGKDINQWSRWVLLDRLSDGVRVETGVKVEAISEQGVRASTPSGDRRLYTVDSIVIAVGMRSVDALVDDLKDRVASISAIGDCTKPGRVKDAIAQGFQAGIEV